MANAAPATPSIDFDFAPLLYVAPTGTVNFNWDISSSRDFVIAGASAASFVGSATATTSFEISGVGAFSPQTAERAFSIEGVATAGFVNPDRHVVFNSISGAQFYGSVRANTAFSANGSASFSLVATSLFPATASLSGDSLAEFAGEATAQASYGIQCATRVNAHFEFNKDARWVIQGKSNSAFRSAADKQVSFLIAGQATYLPRGTSHHDSVFGSACASSSVFAGVRFGQGPFSANSSSLLAFSGDTLLFRSGRVSALCGSSFSATGVRIKGATFLATGGCVAAPKAQEHSFAVAGNSTFSPVGSFDYSPPSPVIFNEADAYVVVSKPNRLEVLTQ